MAKKALKMAKSAKKKPAKKAIKKSTPKKATKKPAAKKPAKKVVAKKVIKKKIAAKKVVAKKVIKKVKAVKPIKKAVAKKKPLVKNPLVKAVKKQVAAPKAKVAKALSTKPIAAVAKTKKATAVLSKKKDASSIDLDDDKNSDADSDGHKAQPFFYEPPKAFIKRPDLMQPKPFIGNDNRTKYSDKELVEFKNIILGKLDEAKRDYDLLKNTLSHKDDHGTDDTSPTFKLLEDGSDVMSKEETAALASRQEKYIQSLQNALIRIENKSYGICRVTGKLIPKERLRSVPHATTSIEGKMQQYA